MKKVLVFFLTLFILTGCVNINNVDLDIIVDSSIKKDSLKYNHSNSGFRYYLPRELRIEYKDDFNEIIKDNKNTYYLYIDLISYYNAIENKYEENKDIYYSRIFNHKGIDGIVNITEDGDNYLIKIEYNYLSVSTKVKKFDINNTVANILLIVKSVSYNNEIVKNILEDDILNNAEEQIILFDNDKNSNELLDIEEDVYTGEDYEFDPDMIN